MAPMRGSLIMVRRSESRASSGQAVEGVGQPVLMEATGHGDKHKNEQRGDRFARQPSRQEHIRHRKEPPKKNAHEGVPQHRSGQFIGSRIMEVPTHRHRRQKLPGTNQWLQMGRHAFRPETPASPKVAISVRILIAAWTSPIPRQAPVPSPNRRSRSKSGFNCSLSRSTRWPRSTDR